MRGYRLQKEVREEVELLQKAGHKFCGPNGSGHCQIRLSNGQLYSLPSTPSDGRWRQNARADIAKMLGLSKAEFEKTLGLVKTNAGRPRKKLRAAKVRRPSLRKAQLGDPLELNAHERANPNIAIERISNLRLRARCNGDRLTAQRADKVLAELYAKKRRNSLGRVAP
jgi:hypothetical protein